MKSDKSHSWLSPVFWIALLWLSIKLWAYVWNLIGWEPFAALFIVVVIVVCRDKDVRMGARKYLAQLNGIAARRR